MRRSFPPSTWTKKPHAPNRERAFRLRTPAPRSMLCPHAVQAAKERSAPSAHGKDAAKKYHCIDTQPSLAGPVGIGFHVEPKRKLIQGKRRSHSVADRHQAA